MVKGTRIKLKYDRLVALMEVYKAVVEAGEIEGKALLYAHAVELHHRMKLQAVKEQESNILVLSNSECVAFRELWSDMPVRVDRWTGEIIRSSVEVVDKYLAGQKVKICRL